MIEQKKPNIKKITVVIFIIIGLIAVINRFTLFYPYLLAAHFISKEEVVQSIGSFSTPEGYKLRDAFKAREGENKIAIFIDEENRQKLIITILREHLKDGLDKIQILDRTKVRKTFNVSGYRNKQISSFRFIYLLHFFRKDDLSGMGDEAIIKGVNVKSQERFETPFADILYVSGEFTKIGLYKEKKGIWHYPTPVFDFETLHEGALAFIKSKKSDKVIVSVSANGIGQFQEKQFREFLQSFEPAA